MALSDALPPLPAPPGDGPVLAGFSGGLDSTVLLHLLAASPAIRARGLRALHVDHGLQPGSSAWAAHCVEAGVALGIEVDVVRVAVDLAGGLGVEGAAREARIAAFAAALPAGGVFALAHHRDDQAETLLLRALRGSGIDALGAMAAQRAFAGGWLWRPLLDAPRDSLQAYARAHDLHWIEDPSNAGDMPDRNFLRHRVLPLLRERWPQADAAFARSATLAAEASRLLDDEDARALAQVQGLDARTLSAPALASLPRERQARVLRRWIASEALPPIPASGIAWAIGAAGHGGAGAFRWTDVVLRLWRDLLHVGRPRPALAADLDIAWDGAAPLVLPGIGTLALVGGDRTSRAAVGDRRADAIDATGAPPTPDGARWRVRKRQGGERITLPGRTHSHALKHVLQDLGIPPWERDLPLLVAADGAVEAVGDLVLSAHFDGWLRAYGLGIAWRPDDAPAPPA